MTHDMRISMNRIREALRRTACLFAIVPALVGTLHAQSGFGNRMGDTLDSEDIRYFSLFPSIPDAVSARVASRNGVTATIQVGRYGAWTVRDTMITIPDSVLRELSTYLDNFEGVYAAEVPVRWPLLTPLVRPGSTVIPGTPFDVDFRNGSSVRGRLLHVTDSMLVLWTGERGYRWQDAAAVRYVRAEEIEAIRQDGNIMPALIGGGVAAAGAILLQRTELADASPVDAMVPGLLFGGLIGAGLVRDAGLSERIGGNYQAFGMVVPVLRDQMELRSSLPRELRRGTVAHGRHDDGMLPVSMSRLMEGRRSPLVVVTVASGFRRSLSENNYSMYESRPDTLRRFPVTMPRVERRLEIEYLALRDLRVGLGYVSMPVQESSTPNHETIGLSAICALIRYDLLPQGQWSTTPFSLSIGAGAGMAFVSESTHLYSTSSMFAFPVRDTIIKEYAHTTSVASFEVRTRLEYAFSHLIRTHVQLDARALEPVRIQSRIEYQTSSTTNKDYVNVKLNSHDVELSSVGLTVGVSVGF